MKSAKVLLGFALSLFIITPSFARGGGGFGVVHDGGGFGCDGGGWRNRDADAGFANRFDRPGRNGGGEEWRGDGGIAAGGGFDGMGGRSGVDNYANRGVQNYGNWSDGQIT